MRGQCNNANTVFSFRRRIRLILACASAIAALCIPGAIPAGAAVYLSVRKAPPVDSGVPIGVPLIGLPLGGLSSTCPQVRSVGSVEQATCQGSAGCYAQSCNGEDPTTMHCDRDATTIDSFSPDPPGDGLVELRYSDACFATWTRITDCYPCYPWEPIVQGADCPGCSVVIAENGPPSYGSDQTTWSSMVSFDYYARACGQTVQDPYYNGGPTCTGWH